MRLFDMMKQFPYIDNLGSYEAISTLSGQIQVMKWKIKL
jgi:hypothetical protein